jgi:hypothetical protein
MRNRVLLGGIGLLVVLAGCRVAVSTEDSSGSGGTNVRPGTGGASGGSGTGGTSGGSVDDSGSVAARRKRAGRS